MDVAGPAGGRAGRRRRFVPYLVGALVAVALIVVVSRQDAVVVRSVALTPAGAGFALNSTMQQLQQQIQEVQRLVIAQQDDARKEFQSLRGGLQQAQKGTNGQEQFEEIKEMVAAYQKESKKEFQSLRDGLQGPKGTPAQAQAVSASATPGLFQSASGKECITPSNPGWLSEVPGSDLKIFSQNGEDGIFSRIFTNIGSTDRYYVEFGTESCQECNTRALREVFGWAGLLMDGGPANANAAINLNTEIITPENINELFAKYRVPNEFDLLSIDIDFDDWWVWRAIDSKFRPRVVSIEFNAHIPPSESRVVDPTDKLRWTVTNYFGASLRAMRDLGKKKGYTLVATDKAGVNSFFVRSDILECQGVQPLPLEQLYNKNGYPSYQHEQNTTRQWLWLDEHCEVVKREYLPE